MSLSLPAVTGWSTFWQLYGGFNGPNTPYAMQNARASNIVRAGNMLTKAGHRAIRAAMRSLVQSGVGGTAIDTYTQADGPRGIDQSDQLGGKRTINTVTTINRVTTNADRDYISKLLLENLFALNPDPYSSQPNGVLVTTEVPFPTDASGNGGGGKLGR